MKILLFYYYPGAGGKFIANCLASSKKVALQDYAQAQLVLGDKSLSTLTDILLATVPDKSPSATRWSKLEKGCKQLFGSNINNVKQNQPVDPVTWNPMNVFDDCWLPVITHWPDHYANCKDFFRNDTVYTVKLNATTEFLKLNESLKYIKLPRIGRQIDNYEDFEQNSLNLEFNHVIDNWDPRLPENLSQIANLAQKLGIDSFDLNSIKPYIDRYINFHIC